MEGPGRGLDRAWTGPGQCIEAVFGVEEWMLAEKIDARRSSHKGSENLNLFT